MSDVEAGARPRGGTIWFVTRKYPPAIGGMERLSYELTQRIARRRPARILARRTGALSVFMFRSALEIAVAARRGSIAVLHLGDPVLSPLSVVARWWRIPVCVTVHGLDVLHDSAPYRWWLRAFFRSLDHYVCISETARTAAIARGAPVERTEVIGIGIDVPPPRNVTREPHLLLFVGRLVQRKGVAWFATSVLPALVSRYPDLRLAVMGRGPEQGAIERAVADAGMSSHLVWLGEVPEETKWDWLAQASVCVMPNIALPGNVEGYGIVALEAAPAAVPLVAADLDGLREALAGGAGGILVEPQNAVAWVAAIAGLLDDPAAAATRGANARAWAAAARGWEAICDRYERMLDALAEPR